jgi:hypothetical protein
VDPNSTRPERDGPSPQPADQPGGIETPTTWVPSEASERREGRRRTLLIVGAFFLVVCLGGSVVGYVLYDRATKIDRGTPVVVVFQYVDAIFELRDNGQAKLFECDEATARSALQPVLDDLEERERRWDIRVKVSVTNFESSEEGASARVEADLLIDVPEADGKPSRSSQRWTFELRDEDGWRVCSAQQIS